MAPAAPHRDFDAVPRSGPEISGTLTLGGVKWRIRARNDVPYELMRLMLGDDDGTLSVEEMAALPVAEQRERAKRVLVQTDDYFASTIVAEQVEDFLAMVHDPTGPFSVERSQEVTNYISECLFSEAGPTSPSRPSQPGRRPTGSTSRASSSSRATPRSTSTP